MLDSKMTLKIITQQELLNAGCFDVASAISVCEDSFRKYAEGDVIFPDKVSVVFDQQTQDRINCLPAGIISEKVYGMKWVSVFPENPCKRNLPNLSAVILLSEMESGFPIALMEGSLCSNLRTASVGAVAAKYFSRKDAKTIGFIGAGEQAKTHFLSMMSVRPGIEVCKVASRTKESEMLFVEQMKKFYPNVSFIMCKGNYEEAVCDADIIVTAISGQKKLLKAKWIKEGCFYCHVAGIEDEYAVAQKADKIVCDNWEVVKHRTQTISMMYKEGLLRDEDVYADLHEIVVGKKASRESETEFIYFNSVGMSYIDVALANWMYKKTVESGLGQNVLLKTKSMFEV